jgi:hypothetical protein
VPNLIFKLLLRTWCVVDPCIIVQFIKKNPTRCNHVSKFYYSIFIWSSTSFGRNTAYHQEPKTALAAFSFCTVLCCTVLCLTTSNNYTSNNLLRKKTIGCHCRFRLLMMGVVSPESCWTTYKCGIIKVWYIVASCWIFLYEFYWELVLCHPLSLFISMTWFFLNRTVRNYIVNSTEKTGTNNCQRVNGVAGAQARKFISAPRHRFSWREAHNFYWISVTSLISQFKYGLSPSPRK